MSGFDGAAYQARFDKLEASGVQVHGEADLVMSLQPRSVLDAGCGTGRVAIELARRGVEVVGVDVSRSMIEQARRQAPALKWVQSDLACMDLGGQFDVVVLAGNVPLFCPADSRCALVTSCAAHVAAGGRLVAGFQLDGTYGLDEWDSACESARLELVERWSTWDRQPFATGDGYAVSLHRPRH